MDLFNYINVILEYLTSKYKYFKNIFFCIIINILPKHLLHVEFEHSLFTLHTRTFTSIQMSQCLNLLASCEVFCNAPKCWFFGARLGFRLRLLLAAATPFDEAMAKRIHTSPSFFTFR